MEIFATFTFEAAHRLPNVPEGHKCGRLHGHNWTVEVWCSGKPDAMTGWLVDFYSIGEEWKRLIWDVVDHRLLNDIPGLDNPTSEKIAEWIWRQLKPAIPCLSKIVLKETPSFGAVYRG